MLSGVFEAQHDAARVNAHEPVELLGRRWGTAPIFRVSFANRMDYSSLNFVGVIS